MLFKKKEKPLRSQNEFEICMKAIYIDESTYSPRRLDTYKERIELTVTRTMIGAEEEVKQFEITLPITGERLLPFSIEGKDFFWDTFDNAIRKKAMPEGDGADLIPGVRIYSNDVMTIEKNVAEKYYSELALSYGSFDGEKYIWCFADGSASPLVFETPHLFRVFIPQGEENNMEVHMLSSDFVSVVNRLSVFAEGYVEALGLNSDNLHKVYSENLKKGN